MGLRENLGTLLVIVLVIVLLLLLVGQQIGQPVLFGYVVTGSMAPTLEAGDGFVAIPSSLAGDVEEGDVITFDARDIQGGGLTTHRVVDETPEGYITRGDANTFTDQDSDEPPVTDGQIVAVALQFNGEIVRIPHLGTAAEWLRGAVASVAGIFWFLPGATALAEGNIGSIMVALGVFFLVLSAITDVVSQGERSVSRSRDRPGVWRAPLVLAVILLLILLPLTAGMAIPSGPIELGIVSSSAPSEDPTVIGVGGSQEFNYTITNQGYVPKVVLLEPASSGVTVDESVLHVSRGETVRTSAMVTAPDQTGFYLRHLSERHYFQLLPTSMILSLHQLHPWIAIIALNGVVGSVVTFIFLVSFGMEPLRLRATSRDIPIGKRLQRALRRWF